MKIWCFLIIVFSITAQGCERKKKDEAPFFKMQIDAMYLSAEHVFILNPNECLSCCLLGMSSLKNGIENAILHESNTIIIVPKIRKAEMKYFREDKKYFIENFSAFYMSDSLFYSQTSRVSVYINRKNDSKILFKNFEI
jgi:hypothetical protein